MRMHSSVICNLFMVTVDVVSCENSSRSNQTAKYPMIRVVRSTDSSTIAEEDKGYNRRSRYHSLGGFYGGVMLDEERSALERVYSK